MIESIATITLIGSLFGMAIILSRKIPDLLALPPLEAEELSFITRLKIGIQKVNPFRRFSFDRFLHKFLLRLRILILKAENQTNHWVARLKERSQEKEKMEESNDYWDELKKAKEGR